MPTYVTPAELAVKLAPIQARLTELSKRILALQARLDGDDAGDAKLQAEVDQLRAEVEALEAAAVSDKLLFAGTRLDRYDLQIDKGSIREVPDPAGSGETVLVFEVPNEGVPTDEGGKVCRAQALVPDALYVEGADLWEAFSVYVPPSFPTVKSWLTFWAVYGPPYAGASPFNLAIEPIGSYGEVMCLRRNGSYDLDAPWAIKNFRGRWIDFLVHQEFSRKGKVELWVDGEPVTFFDGSTYNPRKEASTKTLSMALIDASNGGGPNQSKLMQYRGLGAITTTASLYFKAHRIGRSRASVEVLG